MLRMPRMTRLTNSMMIQQKHGSRNKLCCSRRRQKAVQRTRNLHKQRTLQRMTCWKSFSPPARNISGECAQYSEHNIHRVQLASIFANVEAVGFMFLNLVFLNMPTNLRHTNFCVQVAKLLQQPNAALHGFVSQASWLMHAESRPGAYTRCAHLAIFINKGIATLASCSCVVTTNPVVSKRCIHSSSHASN